MLFGSNLVTVSKRKLGCNAVKSVGFESRVFPTENNAIRPEEPSAVEKGKTVKRPVVIFADDSNSFFEPERDQLEKWQAIRVLRAHVEDVYDLAWCSLQMAAPKSADSEGEEGELLLSGSMDGSTILWHARAGRKICNVKNHDGFVQGVAVDPRGELAASISSDRTVLLYRLNQGAFRSLVNARIFTPSPALSCSELSS